MEILQIVETLGVPVAVAFGMGYAAMFLVRFITDKLVEKLDTNHEIIHGIIVKLIDSNRQAKDEIKELKSAQRTMITIIQKLTGNGLSKYIKEKNE